MSQFDEPPKSNETKEPGTPALLYRKLEELTEKLPMEERLKILSPIQKIILDHFLTYAAGDQYDTAGMDANKKSMEDYLRVTDMIRSSIKFLEEKADKIQ